MDYYLFIHYLCSQINRKLELGKNLEAGDLIIFTIVKKAIVK